MPSSSHRGGGDVTRGDADVRAILAALPAALLVVRADPPAFTVFSVSDEYLRLVGAPRSARREIVGQRLFDVVPLRDAIGPGGCARLRASLARALRSGAADAMPLHAAEPRGDARAWSALQSPVRDGAEGPVRFLVHRIDDVTPLQASRARVARLTRRLARERRGAAVAREANALKAEFLANMSHELRTPLNAIGGYAELLEMGIYGAVTEQQEDALARVHHAQRHLLGLMGDILDFARIEAGRVEYDLRATALAVAMEEVWPMLEPQLAAKRIHLIVRVEPGLLVLADPEKLRQILLNLLSNATKFTRCGGRIEVDTPTRAGTLRAHAADAIWLRVADDGVGIPREQQDAIFDAFVQAHRRLTPEAEGTGLGLTISGRLARGMGGGLRVRSEVGQGSRFTLALPAA